MPHKKIQWFVQDEEDVEFTLPVDLMLERAPGGRSVESLLLDGELDALIHPEVPRPVRQKDQRVGLLFPDYKEREIDYYRRTKIFPMMHTVALRQEIIAKHP